MRIITGTARGRILKSPNAHTRPTMDRVREALFSMLGQRVVEARILELFAGSGAVGLEALSRGAHHATFVDANSTKTIAENAQRCGFDSSHYHIVRSDVLRYQAPPENFDLIFADPPYEGGQSETTASLLTLPDLPRALRPDGLLILEAPPHFTYPEDSLWTLLDQRRYGKSALYFLTPCNDPISPA